MLQLPIGCSTYKYFVFLIQGTTVFIISTKLLQPALVDIYTLYCLQAIGCLIYTCVVGGIY